MVNVGQSNMRRFWGPALLLVVHFTLGCAAQNFVPVRPLEQGEDEVRASVNCSLNKFSHFTLQFSFYHGLSDNQVIGFSMFYLFLPSGVAYARYWDAGDGYQSVQVFFNDLIVPSESPTYEAAYELSSASGDCWNSLKIGLGCFDSPLWFRLFREPLNKLAVLPVIAYRFAYDHFSATAQYMPGTASYLIRRYKDPAYEGKYFNGVKGRSRLPDGGLCFSRADIDTIIQDENSYRLVLKSDKTLCLTERDPYPDCLGCGLRRKSHAAYPASEDHDIFWLHWDYPHGDVVGMAELNMKDILEDYEATGYLRIIEDPDLAEGAIERKKAVIHDVFFSVSHVTADQ